MALSDHARGYLIALAGVLILSPDTLLIRLAAVDPFTLSVARGVLGGLVVLALVAVTDRRGFGGQLRGIGRWGWTVALLQGGGLMLFVLAMDYTTAANVLIVFATTPLIAAVMGWVFLGERVPAATWAAILASVAGLAIVTSGSLGTVHVFGDLLALLDAISLAAFYVVVRRLREISMVPAVGLGMFVGAALALPFAAFPAITVEQGMWILIGSAIVLPLPVILLTTGARYLAAPEVPMLALLETVIGPLWVWLVLGEEPGARSLAGGAVIVTALFLHALLRLRQPAAA